jgi:hypothetical protein
VRRKLWDERAGIRHRHGWSTAFSWRLAQDHQTVENGVFTPSATLAPKLARALGVRAEDLFALRAGAVT